MKKTVKTLFYERAYEEDYKIPHAYVNDKDLTVNNNETSSHLTLTSMIKTSQ